MALIVPEVYSNLVREKIAGRVIMMNLAKDLGEIPQFANIGDTIVFPKWKLIGDAEVMVKGTPLTPDALAQDSASATITQVGKAVRVFDIDAVTALGTHVEEAGEQTAMKIAKKIDDDLIAEAKTTPLKQAGSAATAITADDIEGALQYFGDEIDTEDFAGIVINSRLIKSVMSMPEFVDRTKVTSAEFNGVVRKGLLGFYRMIPIYVSDKGTYDTTTQECISFIVKKGALGFKLKKGLNVEEEREAKLKATDICADEIYAVKLINDAGVVMIKKTIV